MRHFETLYRCMTFEELKAELVRVQASYGFGSEERAARFDFLTSEMALEERAQLPAPERPSVLNKLSTDIHFDNSHWWQNPLTGERLKRNKGELLMLIVSEIAEAMEGERKSLMDDHLPHRTMAEVELADALIRIFDYAGAYNYDLDGAVAEKRTYNATRADHKAESRLAANGKKW
jgi:NTP pyrophosphatase (non-canonical NTP hydrolase)